MLGQYEVVSWLGIQKSLLLFDEYKYFLCICQWLYIIRLIYKNHASIMWCGYLTLSKWHASTLILKGRKHAGLHSNIRGSIWWTLRVSFTLSCRRSPSESMDVLVHGPWREQKQYTHTEFLSLRAAKFPFPPLDGNRFPLTAAPFDRGPTPVSLKVGQRRPRRVFVYTGSWTSPLSLQKSPHNPTTRRHTMCVFIRATNNEGSLCFETCTCD
jgi:hypothetical protein